MVLRASIEHFHTCNRRSRETAMRKILYSTLAFLIDTVPVVAFPTEEVPSWEAAYLAKVKTGAPEQIVAKHL